MFIAKENLLVITKDNEMQALLLFHPNNTPCIVSEVWEVPLGTLIKRAEHVSFKGACTCGKGDHVVSYTSEYDKEKSLVQVGFYMNEMIESGNSNPEQLDTVGIVNEDYQEAFLDFKRIKEEGERLSADPLSSFLSRLMNRKRGFN